MSEAKRNKNIRMTPAAIRKLAELSARAGKSEGDFLSQLILKADQILEPAESRPILALLQDMNAKLDEIADKI